MGAVRRYWEIVKLIFIYVKFKYRQFKLKTNETIVVKTTYGPIRGVKRFSCWNDIFFSFEKIPFAKPPLGELRFKAPQPPEKWTEVIDCTKEGPLPLQNNLLINRMEGSEDCLYLNVFTKNLFPTEPLPVMVWIYGGGFETGGTTKDYYSPDYFMQKDVVLITITYRVGPFGFLSLEDPNLDVPGNAGLKDQVLALKWVKENCSQFGGNPNNITVFGESAGGASTHYMMITDQTKDLFHKAIVMSGSVLAPWAKLPPRSWTYRMAKIMKYDGINNDEKIFSFLQKAKGKSLLAAEKQILTMEEKQHQILFPFGPVIEPYVTEHCVIPEEPRIMMRKAWSTNVPIMIGGTSFEGLIMMRNTKKEPELVNTLGDCEHLVPVDLGLSTNSPESKAIGLSLKETYFNGQEPSMERLTNYLDLLSYKLFWHPMHRTLCSRLKYAKAPNYLYRFDYESQYFNLVKIFLCGYRTRGVCHGDDLAYMFLTAVSPMLRKDSPEYKVTEQILGIFTSFAKTGNPNCPDIQNVLWEPVKPDGRTLCFNVSEKSEIIPLPENDLLKVWDNFYPEEKLY